MKKSTEPDKIIRGQKIFRHKVIRNDTYRIYVCFILGGDIDKINEKFQLQIDDDQEIYCQTNTGSIKIDKDDYRCIFIILNPNIKSKINYATLAHETIHTANHIFHMRYIKYDYDNDEPFAYLVEWIMHNAVNFYKKYLHYEYE